MKRRKKVSLAKISRSVRLREQRGDFDRWDTDFSKQLDLDQDRAKLHGSGLCTAEIFYTDGGMRCTLAFDHNQNHAYRKFGLWREKQKNGTIKQVWHEFT